MVKFRDPPPPPRVKPAPPLFGLVVEVQKDAIKIEISGTDIGSKLARGSDTVGRVSSAVNSILDQHTNLLREIFSGLANPVVKP